MLMLESLFSKKYNQFTYNCSHFVREVWLELTGHDIADMVGHWNSGELANAMRTRHGVIKLDEPENPCLVIFFSVTYVPHIGVWIDGRVLHITEDGVRHDDLAVFKTCYHKWAYYKCAADWSLTKSN